MLNFGHMMSALFLVSRRSVFYNLRIHRQIEDNILKVKDKSVNTEYTYIVQKVVQITKYIQNI